MNDWNKYTDNSNGSWLIFYCIEMSVTISLIAHNWINFNSNLNVFHCDSAAMFIHKYESQWWNSHFQYTNRELYGIFDEKSIDCDLYTDFNRSVWFPVILLSFSHTNVYESYDTYRKNHYEFLIKLFACICFSSSTNNEVMWLFSVFFFVFHGHHIWICISWKQKDWNAWSHVIWYKQGNLMNDSM